MTLASTMHLIRHVLLYAVLLLVSTNVSYAQKSSTTKTVGRAVTAIIDDYRDAGEPFVYSTNLLSDSFLVEAEPADGSPLQVVDQILRPFHLKVVEDSGFYLVTRMSKAQIQAMSTSIFEPADVAAVAPLLESITVSASRYQLSRELANSTFFIDQRTVQNMPDVGEDPIRAAQRLPGTAAGGVSARSHFRGGEQNETGILLNGHRLIDPYHARDYQSIFSNIDARAINGIEVYTGGFPVRYGDHLSGVVLIDSLNPEQPSRTEVGLSVFNTSFLTSGTDRDGDKSWLLSARRGNLDLVLKKELGEPSYYDVFGQFSLQVTPSTQISANAIFADDSLLVVLEDEPDELERSISDTQNAEFWARIDTKWSDVLSSTTVFSLSALQHQRNAETNDEEKFISTASDRRSIRNFGLRQDWAWNMDERHLVQWGFVAEHSTADFDYSSTASYFGLPEIIVGTDGPVSRSIDIDPSGQRYSFYVSDRWRVLDKAVLDLGLRWDTQTYSSREASSQVSPRAGLYYGISRNTDLRLSWGRYHQSQAINELQIEDGITSYFPAQRADHLIVGINHRFANQATLRVEAFQKEMRDLRPRFENLFDSFALIPELAPDRIRISPTRARARGVELSIDRTGEGPWAWWATYTYSKAFDVVAGRQQFRSWDQKHAFLAGLSFSGERWEAAVVANVHSGWPRTQFDLRTVVDDDGEAEFVAVFGERNARRYRTFGAIDARLSRKFDVKRGSLTVFVEISNLTNRTNICCSDFDLLEDDETPTLERSQDFWLPLLPAIGILWEF